MKRQIILTIFLILVLATSCFAQDVLSQLTLSEFPSFKNPFLPALPKEEPPEKEISEKIAVTEKKRTEKPKIEIKLPEVRKIKPPEFIISGLIWNSDRPQAILDNQVVEIGDIVKNSKIIKIDKEGVKIKYEGKYFNIEKSSPADKK